MGRIRKTKVLAIALLLSFQLNILVNIPRSPRHEMSSSVGAATQESTNIHSFSRGSLFNNASVTIQVLDFDGTPLPGAKVKLFSEDWCVRYPRARATRPHVHQRFSCFTLRLLSFRSRINSRPFHR